LGLRYFVLVEALDITLHIITWSILSFFLRLLIVLAIEIDVVFQECADIGFIIVTEATFSHRRAISRPLKDKVRCDSLVSSLHGERGGDDDGDGYEQQWQQGEGCQED
jgi:hypothetical protein